MSLLMEALRKAEEAKRRAAQEQEEETAAVLSLETPADGSSLSLAIVNNTAPEPIAEQVVKSPGNSEIDDIFASLTLTDIPEPDAENIRPDEIVQTSNKAAASIPEFGLLVNEPAAAEPAAERKTETIVADRRQRDITLADAQSSKRSARAMFAAKSKPAANSKTRTVVLASVLGVIVLLSLGAWLLIPMLTPTGSQFYVPATAGTNPLPTFDLTADDASTDTADDTFTDTADDAFTDTTDDASTDTADALLIADISETAAPFETDVRVATFVPSQSTVLKESVEPLKTVSPQTEGLFDEPVIQQRVAPVPALAISELVTEPPPAPSSPIQISRSTSMRNPDMQMMSAWSAYQQGDYAAARILYQQSLAVNPDNRDAILGVAASALQQGDTAFARQAYTHLLNMNPRDPLARTGLLETTANNDPMQREIDLKALLTNYPDIAAISYSLGNLYAGQQRWHDAQQAYYNALLIARTHGSGPLSPDYAFNLAISLERINQPQAALNFYREARSLTEQHAASFDSSVLDQRLQALERSLP